MYYNILHKDRDSGFKKFKNYLLLPVLSLPAFIKTISIGFETGKLKNTASAGLTHFSTVRLD